MDYTVLNKVYKNLPINISEILRYCGCKSTDDSVTELLFRCMKELENKLVYKICYCVLPLKVTENVCNLGLCTFTSTDLAKAMNNCNEAIIFSATIGIEIDRLINKYSYISPAKSLMFQAIGSERIETLCDTFCKETEKEIGAKTVSRFSPGYGDLCIEYQKDIFSILNCTKNIGLSLNNSLLMTPTKSVTAIVGIKHCKNEEV